MTRIKRPLVPGGTFFFTVHLSDPDSDLLLREIGHLRAATRATKTRFPFRIEAAVILPSVLHMIWTLPAGDSDYSNRWAMLKASFSKGLPTPAHRTKDQAKRNEKGIWRPGFKEKVIRNPADFALHLDFIHNAPVAAGLVEDATDWLHSSIHRQHDPYYAPEALSFGDVPRDQELLHGLILPMTKAKVQEVPMQSA